MRYIDGMPVPEEGDRVLVRSDLKIGKAYNNLPFDNQDIFIKDMEHVLGKYVTIRSQHYYGFRIREAGCNWTTNMFDLKEYEGKQISVSKDDLMEFLR